MTDGGSVGPAGGADLRVTGGRVLRVDGSAVVGDVVIRGGRIVDVGPPGGGRPGTGPRLDAEGCVVVPGFVDLQCNGAGGIDLTTEPERLWEVSALLPRWGVTAWLPTIVTAPATVRSRARRALRDGRPAAGPPPAEPLGLHYEGPFLAPERRGAHAADHLRPPTVAAVDGWSRAAGVALVTLAPELPGALDVVRSLTGRGVVVAAGHSSATADQAVAAADAGVRWVTHLFNAMAPLHHRDPGLVGVALTDERLGVGVIADGLHLHPTTVALAARTAGPRLTLVTDAVAALGAPPGPVRLGAVAAVSDGAGVRLADGTLAGSMLSMDRAVANLMAFTGCGLARAVAAATSAPSRLLGQEGERGAVVPGSRGDLVLLDDGDDYGVRPVATVVGGRVAYELAPGRVSTRRSG